jgi:periplasmic divalent cation tolerance protein
MEIEYIVVLVTVPNPESGQTIASRLLEDRLAACVNILPAIRSLYTWKSAVQDDTESLLVIKSRLALFERLAEAVKSIHPYETPEIIALPVLAGSAEYLTWIKEETQR